jgi:purine-binding chemotaxis protein CheW
MAARVIADRRPVSSGSGGKVVKSMLSKEKKVATVDDDVVQFVTFQVGDEEYGVDIRRITEVIRPIKIKPLPRMPEFIEGVINLRGMIIPIVDLRKRFALSRIVDNPRKMRMLITKGAIPGASGAGRELLGLVVDSVQEVLHINRKDIEPAPQAARGQHAGFITGMGKISDRLIILIDSSMILSQQERSALAEASHDGP